MVVRVIAPWRGCWARFYATPSAALRDSAVAVLADTKQADHLVDGDVPLFELAGRVGPDELLDRHTYSALNFALEIRGLLLRSEIYHRRITTRGKYLGVNSHLT